MNSDGQNLYISVKDSEDGFAITKLDANGNLNWSQFFDFSRMQYHGLLLNTLKNYLYLVENQRMLVFSTSSGSI